MTHLITALDVDVAYNAVQTVERCGECSWFKVGLQLFSREGPQIVDRIHDMGKHVFLDLKLHDIPNTVAHAAAAAAELDCSLTTVHALGGRAMIKAAREAVEGSQTSILAVTVLTSLDEDALRDEVGLHETPSEAVQRLAAQSMEAGAHGIVCSPHEIELVREAAGPDALIVTPGIRPDWSVKHDQARVTTPKEAAQRGATHVVVGRPILTHDSPAHAVDLILKELRQ